MAFHWKCGEETLFEWSTILSYFDIMDKFRSRLELAAMVENTLKKAMMTESKMKKGGGSDNVLRITVH